MVVSATALPCLGHLMFLVLGGLLGLSGVGFRALGFRVMVRFGVFHCLCSSCFDCGAGQSFGFRGKTYKSCQCEFKTYRAAGSFQRARFRVQVFGGWA